MFIVQNLNMITVLLVSALVALIIKKFRHSFVNFLNKSSVTK